MKKKGNTKKKDNSDDKLRIAILNVEKCKPKKCGLECKKTCPVNKSGRMCIEVENRSPVAAISEILCIGCGMCVKKCPFQAIQIINLPKALENQVTHRYGPNSFKLHRLPTPRPGEVLGLVGTNGIGKSTALKILAGKMKPNLGNFEEPPDWEEIIKYFRGSELQTYFTKLLEDNLKAVIKIQYVDNVIKSKQAGGIVRDKLEKADTKGLMETAIESLDLHNVLDRNVKNLSGGELQRFIIALCCLREADIYMFDEPSSYLDVKQRLKAGRMIRSLLQHDNYVICVEHDLAILDYLSDFTCCLYGVPGAYGVVTMPFSVREGINVFLAGFIPTENMRFRDTELNFKVMGDKQDEDDEVDGTTNATSEQHQYPALTKALGTFNVKVEAGKFNRSEIVVLLGENGTGKSTFIHMLAGMLKPDNCVLPKLSISIKPQKIAPKFEGTVQNLFDLKLKGNWKSSIFQTEVMKPLTINELLDNDVQTLSGGELQRVALTLALGKKCDIYLIDEPSAYLDSEQRINAAKVIKRWIMNTKTSGFVVEHDFIMASYLADKVVVFEGQPAIETFANAPEGLVQGMNRFLKMLDITFRRDPTNFRPRINKLDSQKDQEQKKLGLYFLTDEAEIERMTKKNLTKKEQKAKDKKELEDEQDEIKDKAKAKRKKEKADIAEKAAEVEAAKPKPKEDSDSSSSDDE